MMARRSFILALFIFSALTAASGQTPSDVSEKAEVLDKTVAVMDDGVRFEPNELAELKSLADIKQALLRKGVAV